MQRGGVSLQPPARSMRTGALAHTAWSWRTANAVTVRGRAMSRSTAAPTAAIVWTRASLRRSGAGEIASSAACRRATASGAVLRGAHGARRSAWAWRVASSSASARSITSASDARGIRRHAGVDFVPRVIHSAASCAARRVPTGKMRAYQSVCGLLPQMASAVRPVRAGSARSGLPANVPPSVAAVLQSSSMPCTTAQCRPAASGTSNAASFAGSPPLRPMRTPMCSSPPCFPFAPALRGCRRSGNIRSGSLDASRSASSRVVPRCRNDPERSSDACSAMPCAAEWNAESCFARRAPPFVPTPPAKRPANSFAVEDLAIDSAISW